MSLTTTLLRQELVLSLQSLVYNVPPILSRLPDGVEPDEPLPSCRNVLYTQNKLPSISFASLRLWRRLSSFRPAHRDYASALYEDAFNWRQLRLPLDLECEWYAVAFRSLRKESSDTKALYEADQAAHEEAIKSGGLFFYWYGEPTADGKNLATCIWESRADALRGLRGPKHHHAASLARSMYHSYTFERYRLIKRAGRRTLQIEDFTLDDRPVRSRTPSPVIRYAEIQS